MKFIPITFFLLISLTAIAQGQKNFIDQNYIEVTGKAELSVIPDKIYISILLQEADSKNKVSLSELETNMINRLENIGIDTSKDLLVKDIGSNFKPAFLSKDNILLSKEYQLLVRNGKTANSVYEELKKAGISNISIVKLDHSKIVDFRKEVKINAIKAAKEKAALLAIAVDQSIGKALYIQEQNSYKSFDNNIRLSNSISQYEYSDVVDKESNIDFEKIKLEYSMLCRFELK